MVLVDTSSKGHQEAYGVYNVIQHLLLQPPTNWMEQFTLLVPKDGERDLAPLHWRVLELLRWWHPHIFEKKNHEKHMAQDFPSFSDAKLKNNFKSSKFFKSIVVFFGRGLYGATKNTKQGSVARISQLRKPYDMHSLCVFLDFAGHFRGFIQGYASK